LRGSTTGPSATGSGPSGTGSPSPTAPAAGDDGFQDTRTRSERRGDALVDLLTGATPTNDTAAGADVDALDTDVDDPGADAGDDPEPEPGMPGLPGGRGGVVLNLITTLAELRAGIPGTGHLDTGAPLSVAASASWPARPRSCPP
jgi:hypothetical protein